MAVLVQAESGSTKSVPCGRLPDDENDHGDDDPAVLGEGFAQLVGQAISRIARPMMSTIGGSFGSPNVSDARSMPLARSAALGVHDGPSVAGDEN